MSNRIIDRKTLAWVKEGIEEHLKDILHAPDAYMENLDDPLPIEACIKPLQLIKGAVEIVGVSGATLLAEELVVLARAIVAGKVKHKLDAAEVLAAGMLQLPGYLDSLYHGQPDIPLILLPQLNDLRAVQDKELLTEGEFFSPDLSVPVPLQPVSECIVSGDLITVARKLRPGYLSGLLGIIREEDVIENVEKLILVVDNLLIASKTEKAKQLWWIALGVIESLYERGLELSVALKILLGRVDRHIQIVIEKGEAVFATESPDKIIKNLLYYIAQSQTYNTRVIEMKKSYGLDYPEDNVVKRARESLYGFNANLIDTIAEQVREELTSIKTALEICIHARKGSPAGLEDTLKNFNSIADALGMLGMNSQKDFILKQKNFLDSIVSQQKTLTEDDVMGIASAILHIEGSLNDLGSTVHSMDDEDELSPADYEESLKLVSKEILKEIGTIKDALQDYLQSPESRDLLQPVPDKLSGLVGAMHVLSHDNQASLIQSVRDYVMNELINNKTTVEESSLELLADAIAGVENFYQTILEESVAPELGLHIAAQSLTDLGYQPKEVAANPYYGNYSRSHDVSAVNLH